MSLNKINWQIWFGFILSVFAFASYPLIFAGWPVTRDFPWANLLLFAFAAIILFAGVRRAFRPEKGRLAKAGAVVSVVLSTLVLGLFVMIAFVSARWLPPSTGAPQIGSRAPEFSLSDTAGQKTTLAHLLTTPIQTQSSDTPVRPRGVLLIFYRGYW